MSDMLELCPPTQHNNVFFAVLFLQRLPREIRVLLTHEDHTDLRRLAAHADRLVAFGGGQQSGHAAITAEDTEENTVAAIKGKTTPQLQKNKYQKQQAALQTAAAASPAATGRPERHNQPISFQPGAAVFWPVFLPLGPW